MFPHLSLNDGGKCNNRLRGLLLCHLAEEVLSALAHFFGGEVFLVGAHAPDVTEGIGETAPAVAPELVGYGHAFFAAGRDGLLECLVDIGNVNLQAAGAAAKGLW